MRFGLAAAAFALLMCTQFSGARADDDFDQGAAYPFPPGSQVTVPDPGQTMTVPFSANAIEPAQFNGDVRTLPPLPAPDFYHVMNEYEGPPDRKPPATDPRPLAPKSAAALSAMPATIANFAGLSYNTLIGGVKAGAGYPPDTNGDVGLTYYIQSVNDAYGIFDKSTGAMVAGFTENQLWAGAGTGTKCDANNFGDPVVLYDQLADRWILTNFAFSVNAKNIPITPFYQCIAVSKTSDPVAGGWWLYAVRMDPGGTGAPPVGTLNDYGKFGLDTNCLYMGANGFTINPTTGASAYVGIPFAAWDRTALYSGAALTSSNSSVGFLSGGTYSTFPANRLGTSADSIPAAGTPEYFVAESQSLFAFEVRKFQQGATACGTGSSLGAVTSVSQTSYTYDGGAYIPQSGTTNKLDSLEDRVMQKVQYRKIGAAESLWVVHTTGAGTAGDTAKLQWAQLNVSGGTIAATPLQQQIYAPDSTLFRWMGGLAVDGQGNMAVGYSTSSSSTFPSIAYSGRLAGDAANTLGQGEASIVNGGGSQTVSCSGTCVRWGDYSSMSIDPADDCTFWYTSEYYDTQTNGTSGNWQTRIASFRYPTCNGKQNQTISFTSTAPASAKLLDSPYVVTATATSGLAVTLTINASSTSVCSLSGSASGSQVSFLTSGTCTINANQAGNATYSAAPQAQQSFTISKASQTINFTSTAPASAKFGDPAYTVTATATSGLAVTLTIDATATSVCSLSGSQVTYLTSGTCKIDANQSGNATYAAATQAQQSFTVGKAAQTISFTSIAPASATFGDPAYTVTATATSGLAVTLTIDATATSVCSLSGSQVTYLTSGTCKIDANQAGNGSYSAAPQAQQLFTISKASQTINFTSTAPASAKFGDPAYVVTATATSGLAVTLTINAASASVCSLSGSTSGSQVTYLSTGTCAVNANQGGNTSYSAAPQVQQSFTVSKSSQTINFTSTAPVGAKFGDVAYTVTATATSGLAVTLTVDATAASVCSLSGAASGSQVTYLAPGTCKIDANQAGDSNYSAAPQAQQSFAVSKASQTINFTSSAPVGAKFGDVAYTVTATATSGLAITLTVDATAASVCSLSGAASGSQVTYLAPGTCKIDANQAGDNDYSAAPQAQQSFAVSKASQTINFTSTAPVGAKFGDPGYTVTATATSGLAVTLAIDPVSASVCSLSGSTSGSQVTYLAAGTCLIDANQIGNANYSAAPQAQQSYAVGKAAQTINFTSTAPIGAKFGDPGYTVTATATSGLAVTLTIDPASASVCSLSGSTSGSQVTYLAAGTCLIDANQSGNSNYSAAPQAQQSYGVGKAAQTVNFTSTVPASAKFGDAAYTVTATATSGLAVTLTIDPASASVCALSGSTSGSQVSYLATGSCAINANQAGNSNYSAAPQAQQSFTVSKASQTINFTSTAPASAKFGDAAYTVTATATSGLAVTLTVDVTSTSVCSLSGSTSGSQVTYLATGTCAINANQVGNSNYSAAPQALQSFTVSKASQTINFTSTAPASAKFGDPAYTVTATATSGLAVTLTIDATATSVCSLSGSQVTYLTSGTCKIDANQSGNATYAAATQAQQSFAVGKAAQAINFTSTAPAGASFGDPAYTVTATATSGLAVTLTIDATSTSVCSLSGSQVTYLAPGTCKIDANQAGNGSYSAAAQAQQSYGVGKSAQTVNFTSTAPASAKFGDAAYTVTATATSGLAVTLTIDPASASVCALSGSTSGSQVSYLATGSCIIDANQGGNSNYSAAPQAQQSYGIGKAAQTVTFTSTAPANPKFGDPAYTVTANATSGLAVTLTIDATSASVCALSGSASGSQVSYLATGTCIIDANQGGNSNYSAAPQAQQSYAVAKASQTINFASSAPASAKVGDPAYAITAAATSGLAVTLTLDAASTGICSISGSASGSLVTFLASGTCAIDANQAGNGSYSAASPVQQSFTVGKAAQTINFTSSAPSGAKFGDAAYVVTATATSALPITLSIDAASAGVCSLSGSSSGSQVTLLGAGVCTIDANQGGNGSYNPAPQAQQTFTIGKAAQTVNFTSTAPASAGFGDAAYVVTATSTSGLPVTVSIHANSTSVCALDGSVTGSHVTYLSPGTCRIDANQGGDGNFDPATQAQQTFAVGKGSQTIDFTSTAPANAKVGDTAYAVTATATSGLPVVLSIDAVSAGVCAIDGPNSGAHVSFLAAGNCTVDANQSGDADYDAAALAQQAFTISAGASHLVFTLQPSDVAAGAPLGSISVSKLDPLDQLVEDSSSDVTFTIPACGSTVTIGTTTMLHGIAMITPALRLYTVTDPATLKVTAQSADLSALSNAFKVTANTGLMFADGFECRL